MEGVSCRASSSAYCILDDEPLAAIGSRRTANDEFPKEALMIRVIEG